MTCESFQSTGISPTNYSHTLPALAFKSMAGIIAFGALALATIRPLSPTYPVSLERTWNENLQGALLTNDVTAYNYANGVEIVRGDLQDKSVIKKIVAAINNTQWTIKEMPIQKIFGRQYALENNQPTQQQP